MSHKDIRITVLSQLYMKNIIWTIEFNSRHFGILFPDQFDANFKN